MAGRGKRLLDAGFTKAKPLVKVNNKTLAEHSITTLGIEHVFFLFITRPFENEADNEELLSILNNLGINFSVVHVKSGGHYGSAHSALYAQVFLKQKQLLDYPLIITNCDQIMDWDGSKFIDFVKESDADGAVVLHKSDNPKNSFAKIEDDLITEIKEKTPISNNALVGIHYWKHARDFVESAQQLVAFKKSSMDQTTEYVLPNEEAYISETYNYLIKDGKKIYPYWLKDSEKFIPIGTPEDIERYLSDQP